MTRAVQPMPAEPFAVRSEERPAVEVTLLPTLPIHAGASMSLYTSDLLRALESVPGVTARVHWPSFGSAPPKGRFQSRWVRYVEYVRLCRRLPGNLFHITDHSNAQLLLALPGAKTAVTCHDLYPVAVARGHLKFATAEGRLKMTPTALRLGLLRKAAAIIAISKHTLEECIHCLGIRKDRLFLAHYGISGLFYSRAKNSPAELRRRLGIQPGQIAILHVGSNDARKNLRTVFRVVAALRENDRKEVCLVKVGSKFGPREKGVIQELGLREAVRELGPLPAEETVQAYQASDVLLYPSFHEGFCRPVAEAMASGTPVVASNQGAIPEVAQDTQLLFDPEDVERMAKAIVQIAASSDLRQEMVQRGQLAARNFTWEAHGAAVAEAYRVVASRWV